MTAIVTIALDHWYAQGVARMITAFAQFPPSPELDVKLMAWINALPPGAPAGVIEEGEDYIAYCARPFLFQAGFDAGADAVIYLDASYYAIAVIDPLVAHIEEHGYYLQANKFMTGQWISNRALASLGLSRDQALAIPEVAGGAVGFHRNRKETLPLIAEWAALAADRLTIPGHRTNSFLFEGGRDLGPVSNDTRVLGHRPGQAVLSVLAHQHGLTTHVERPKLCAYRGKQTAETCLVLHGAIP